MGKRGGSYPHIRVSSGGSGVVSQAGAVLLVETVRRCGLDSAMSAALAPWRRARAVHDPGKVLLDVALAVALSVDCLADIGMLRAEPAVFGPVATDPMVVQEQVRRFSRHSDVSQLRRGAHVSRPACRSTPAPWLDGATGPAGARSEGWRRTPRRGR
ncbi:transposase [Streptomyces sp. NPDC056910]|uniref:transposase n=1 Tax=Streptomyces sp. NPDC056910 TaxID=3345964 RepID=UPI0036A61C7E